MNAVYDKAFKRGDAQKGFEISGLFPLNRQKITDEKLRLGKIFSELNPETESDTESEIEIESDSDMELDSENASNAYSNQSSENFQTPHRN